MTTLCITTAITASMAAWAQDPAGPSKELGEKAAYIIGNNFGESLGRDDLGQYYDALKQGMEDAFAGKTDKYTMDEQQSAMMDFTQQMNAKRKADSEIFMAENATKEGVQVTESGLQYIVIEEGTGETPAAGDMVKTNYRGTFTNGKEFDSSYERGEPAEFDPSRVIPGWKEALFLMKEGAKYKVFIPPALGYGENGQPRMGMPGNATLIFEMELLEVMKGAAAEAQQMQMQRMQQMQQQQQMPQQQPRQMPPAPPAPKPAAQPVSE